MKAYTCLGKVRYTGFCRGYSLPHNITNAGGSREAPGSGNVGRCRRVFLLAVYARDCSARAMGARWIAHLYVRAFGDRPKAGRNDAIFAHDQENPAVRMWPLRTQTRHDDAGSFHARSPHMVPFPHRYSASLSRTYASHARIEAPPLLVLHGGPSPELDGAVNAWSPEHM